MINQIKRAIILANGLARGRLHSKEPGVVLIIYHRVGSGTDSPIDIPLTVFERQLDYLQDNYRIVGLDFAADALEEGAPGEPLAVLTFDDGYWDFFGHVLPVLTRRGLPSVLYVATRFIGTGQPFPWDLRWSQGGAEHVRPLTWYELRELASAGSVTIASHGHSHRCFDRLTIQELEIDLATARRLIRENIGIEARHVACPRGIYSPAVRSVAPEFARTVAIAGWRPNYYGRTDLCRCERVPAMPDSDLRFFASSLRGAGRAIELLAQTRNHFGRLFDRN